MSDSYIRRSAAIDQICRHIGSLHTSREESLLVWVVGTLRTMPAADVAQVVRCENCKHVRRLSMSTPGSRSGSGAACMISST